VKVDGLWGLLLLVFENCLCLGRIFLDKKFEKLKLILSPRLSNLGLEFHH
jgi:hypothetical protein